MVQEFVIWGKAPDADHESLLVSERVGLRDRKHAEEIMRKLSDEHGCTAMRIQELAPLGDASEVQAMFARAMGK